MTVGGIDTTELARRFKTPLYVFDEDAIAGAVRALQKAFDENYGGNASVLYASKAFSCREIYRIMDSLGAGIDVVSGGELYTALSAGFPAERIYFHGNNKTPDEIEEAVTAGVGRMVIDNFEEIGRIEKTAAAHGVRREALIRVKPGIDVHTHKYVRTGQIDSKFGFALSTGEAEDAAAMIAKMPHIKLVGLHAHIGSQIFETEPFGDCARLLIDFAAALREKGTEIEELNLGGGYGIRYTGEDDPLPPAEFVRVICSAVKEHCRAKNIPEPKLLIEPGRSIVGPAGITLYTVGGVKNIPGVRTYVSIDGGMTDNPRYILYGSKYDAVIADRADGPRDAVVTIAGKCCESGDLIRENIRIQTPAPGDILAVFGTGAYNYSMASNYNRIPRPAAVMIRGGEARLIIRRETYGDLIRNDI